MQRMHLEPEYLDALLQNSELAFENSAKAQSME
jgi:hypothetical protein